MRITSSWTSATPSYISLWIKQWESRACTTWVKQLGGGYLQHPEDMEAQTISNTPSLRPNITQKKLAVQNTLQYTPHNKKTHNSLVSYKWTCDGNYCSFFNGSWSSTLLSAISNMQKTQPILICKFLLVNDPGHIQFKHSVARNHHVLAFARPSLCS